MNRKQILKIGFHFLTLIILGFRIVLGIKINSAYIFRIIRRNYETLRVVRAIIR